MNEQENKIWKDDTLIASYPHLKASKQADVLIVGGGLTGVLSAYLLSQAGKKVILIEKNRIGDGATHLTTAFLTKSIDTDTPDLIKMFGVNKAKQIILSHSEAIDQIEKISHDLAIKSNFTRCSNYIYAHSEKSSEDIEQEYKALQKLGIEAEYHTTDNLGFPHFGYIELLNQAKFHPLTFLAGLLMACENNGVEFFEHTEAKEFIDDHTVHTASSCTIKASTIIVATYEPFDKPLGLYFKKGFYTTYVYEAEFPTGKIKEGIYEDVHNPYHYFRLDKGKSKDTLIVGGEDHRSDLRVDPVKNFKALKDFLDNTFLGIRYKIIKQWHGPILEPVDGLAFIGKHKRKNTLYAFGFSGNGMTYAMIASQIFHDIILGKKNKNLALYSAKRVPKAKSLLIKARDFGEEFIKGALKNVLKKRTD